MDALEKRLQELEAGKGGKAKQQKESEEPKQQVEPKKKEPKKRRNKKKLSKGTQTQDAPRRKSRGVLWELLMIGIKIAAILCVIALVFTLVFGIARNKDVSMYPSVKDGDLVIYYRLDKEFVKDDTIVVKYDGEVQSRRVMAIAGDTVDINENGLYINGSLQAEKEIHQDTLPYEEGVRFPITVGENEVFVLGDGRENATDSRVYGCVNVKDSLGKVMMIVRTRGI